jgi:hypothetical protein
MELGFRGKEIGDKLDALLINVYAENVRNNRDDLLNLLGKKEQMSENMNKNIAYSAVVLDQDSHDKLVTRFEKFIPEDWEVIAHHMTINMGEIREDLKDSLGEEVRLEVISFAKDDLVAAVGVSGFQTNNEIPHVTLAVNRKDGGKPFFSNKLKNWVSLPTPFVITGKVEEVPR